MIWEGIICCVSESSVRFSVQNNDEFFKTKDRVYWGKLGKFGLKLLRRKIMINVANVFNDSVSL